MIFNLKHKNNGKIIKRTDLLNLGILDIERSSNSGKSLSTEDQLKAVTNCLKYLESEFFVYFINEWYSFEEDAVTVDYKHSKPISPFAIASHQKIAGTFLAWLKSENGLSNLQIELSDMPDFILKDKNTDSVTLGDFGKIGFATFFRIFPFLSEHVSLVIVKPHGELIYLKFKKQYDPEEVFTKWLQS